jgi:hypothetical protein
VWLLVATSGKFRDRKKGMKRDLHSEGRGFETHSLHFQSYQGFRAF